MCTVSSSLFLNNETKSLFTPWKFGLIKNSKYGFGTSVDTVGSYLFQLIALLKPNFNYCNSFALFWVDKVTTGTSVFVSVIVSFVAFVSLDNKHLSDQVKLD